MLTCSKQVLIKTHCRLWIQGCKANILARWWPQEEVITLLSSQCIHLKYHKVIWSPQHKIQEQCQKLHRSGAKHFHVAKLFTLLQRKPAQKFHILLRKTHFKLQISIRMGAMHPAVTQIWGVQIHPLYLFCLHPWNCKVWHTNPIMESGTDLKPKLVI